jgi:hypothetical protein
MIMPWYLEEPRMEEALDPEEAVSPQALAAADDESEGGRSWRFRDAGRLSQQDTECAAFEGGTGFTKAPAAVWLA